MSNQWNEELYQSFDEWLGSYGRSVHDIMHDEKGRYIITLEELDFDGLMLSTIEHKRYLPAEFQDLKL